MLADRLSPGAKDQYLAWRLVQKARGEQTNPLLDPKTLTFRGNQKRVVDFQPPLSTSSELMLSGPSETGKTFACLYKLDQLARTYKDSQWAIVRKIRADMPSTVLEMWDAQFARPEYGWITYGGRNPHLYVQRKSGAKVWVGGMDRPGRVLSGSRDGVYVNQAEELDRKDWETLTTRVTGRAGNAPFGILFGDCNPEGADHWILHRERLQRWPTLHTDNPSLYNEDGSLTPRGRSTISTLESLSEPLRSRLFKGMWINAEGLIYLMEWLDLEHGGTPAHQEDRGNVRDDADYVPGAGPVMWWTDDGYSAGSAVPSRGLDERGHYVANSHPRVILFVQRRGDGTYVVFDEMYACLKLSHEQLQEAKERWPMQPEYVSHGPGAGEWRGRLIEAGQNPFFAGAKVVDGIATLRGFLKCDANGKRRMWVHPRCTHFRWEMRTYSWKRGSEDEPEKQFDHGPDAARGGAWVEERN